MEYPNFNEEKKLWGRGYKIIIGLDEAGRGPLAGPVVAGAVIIIKSKIKNQKSKLQFKIENLKVDDSKKLSVRQRENLYNALIKNPNIIWGVGKVSEKVIDKINILEATKLAMERAIKNLEKKLEKTNTRPSIFLDDRRKIRIGGFLLIDGNFGINSSIPQKSIIKGDQKVFSIAAASIIAKVSRDWLMQKLHKKYPQYGFDVHKGYPTLLHRQRIRQYGLCKIHRKTFHFS